LFANGQNNRDGGGNREGKEGASCFWHCGPCVGARGATSPVISGGSRSGNVLGCDLVEGAKGRDVQGEVLLDRLDLSPGVVDEKTSKNGAKAIVAFQRSRGLLVIGKLGQAINPVGLVWIDLSKVSYGIHETPGPEEIGKTQSHGCIRLTNWDALDLANRVRKGTPVAFLDETEAVSGQ
jgi:L,D-transpeptidase catalytic domain